MLNFGEHRTNERLAEADSMAKERCRHVARATFMSAQYGSFSQQTSFETSSSGYDTRNYLSNDSLPVELIMMGIPP